MMDTWSSTQNEHLWIIIVGLNAGSRHREASLLFCSAKVMTPINGGQLYKHSLIIMIGSDSLVIMSRYYSFNRPLNVTVSCVSIGGK